MGAVDPIVLAPCGEDLPAAFAGDGVYGFLPGFAGFWMSFPPGPPAFLRAVKPPPPHLAHNRLAAKTTMLGVSIHRLYETFLSSKVVGLAVIPHVFLGQSGPNGYLAVAESTLTKLGYLFFLIVCHWHVPLIVPGQPQTKWPEKSEKYGGLLPDPPEVYLQSFICS